MGHGAGPKWNFPQVWSTESTNNEDKGHTEGHKPMDNRIFKDKVKKTIKSEIIPHYVPAQLC